MMKPDEIWEFTLELKTILSSLIDSLNVIFILTGARINDSAMNPFSKLETNIYSLLFIKIIRINYILNFNSSESLETRLSTLKLSCWGLSHSILLT
jgi:hypothetical protein